MTDGIRRCPSPQSARSSERPARGRSSISRCRSSHWRFSASFEPSENVSEGVKLLGFDGGVTVQGGLPVVIATPAHGTAFDIVGQGIASPTSSQKALEVAIAVASRRAAAVSTG